MRAAALPPLAGVLRELDVSPELLNCLAAALSMQIYSDCMFLQRVGVCVCGGQVFVVAESTCVSAQRS